MRAEFISPFTKNESKVHAHMERYPELRRAVTEMCHEFNLHVDVPTMQPDSVMSASLLTSDGIFAGTLSRHRRYDDHVSGDDYFLYKSPLVQKERSSARSSKDARDAKKITGIISALKKNKEVPTTDALAKQWNNSLRYAFISVLNYGDRTKKSVHLEDDTTLALVRMFIENDKVTVETHRNKLETAYQAYLDNVAKQKTSEETFKRFSSGCTAIGVFPDQVNIDKKIYIVCDAEYDSGKGSTVKNPQRFSSLTDSPVAADAAIFRTYAQGKDWFDNSNELGLPSRDKYLDDLDMSMGFMNTNNGIWLIIPKQHA